MGDTLKVMTESKEVMKLQCGRCRYMIGMVDSDHLSLKTNEIFIYFYGGMVIISCKNCQCQNIVADDDYEKTNPETVFKAESMLNSVRAVHSKWYNNNEHKPRD